MEEIGKKRGCLLRGGEIDYEKVAELLLHELRAGRLGRISFEFPEDWIGKEEMGYAGDDRGN